jgi:2-polyprenyl-3-methyl-5-hydroxy-6-metoxy-1,4-benzoquinol methylase
MAPGVSGIPLNSAAQEATDDYRDYPCDLCGAQDPVEVPRCRSYTNDQPVHVCRNCGFVYVVRRRSAQRIAAVWSEEIFGSGYTAAIPAVAARLTYVAEFLRLHVELTGRRLCEIGAGEGEFLDIIRGPRYGAEAFGVEPSQANSQRLTRLGLSHFTGTVEEYAAQASGGAPFDIVAILWTLENCQDCRRMLALAHAMLKPGGSIVVATGSRLLVPFKKPLHTYFSTNPSDTHAFRFSANTLRGVLAVSSFEPLHINRYLDHDILCVIGRRLENGQTSAWRGDDHLAICNFFERWHVDTTIYFPDQIA